MFARKQRFATWLLCSSRSFHSESVLLETQRDGEGLHVFTLNRPRQRNALSESLLQSLEEGLLRLRQDSCEEVRAVVVQGNGPVFCSGHDLKEMTSPEKNSESAHRELFERCSRVMKLVEELPQPVIAATHGVATAAGCQLAAAADLTVSSRSCKFATPGVSIGLFCSTPAVPLVRCVGKKAAMDMLLTGRLVEAPEAKRIGLVSHICDSDEAQDVQKMAQDLALQVAGHSGVALRLGKQTFRKQMDLNLADAYRVASETMTENMKSSDANEGIKAFLEKRRPEWTHK